MALPNSIFSPNPPSYIPNTNGDQELLSTDTSIFRTGSWVQSKGALYTLVGDLVMWYWSHNVALDANGNFLGRDDTGPCTMIVFTEGLGLTGYMQWLRYDAPSGAAGTIPAFGTGIQVSGLQWHTGIPMILPSSGSIGNNGALTGITALPLTYSNGCYMYFPANAISTGSTAGMYYVVMSSTTAGTIYNNTYTAGATPTIPATPTPFVTTGPGAYTQTTAAAITLLSLTIPGGSMGPNGSVEATCMWSNSGTTNNKTMSVLLGTTAINQVVQATAANISAQWSSDAYNRGVQNAQIFGPLTQVGYGVSTSASVAGSVDTSQNQAWNYQGNLATATDFIILDAANVAITYSL
jgi:hypothetical protein